MSPSTRMQEYRAREKEVIRSAELARQLREVRTHQRRSAKPTGDIAVGIEIITSANDG